MEKFKQINEARKILGLDEYATLEDINESYRKLALKYHPDRCKGERKKECEELIKKISCAKDILMGYCAVYRYSFKEKDVERSLFDKDFYKHLQRFYDGWWGDI